MGSKTGHWKMSTGRTRKGQGFFSCGESSWEQQGSIGRSKYEFLSLQKYDLRLTRELTERTSNRKLPNSTAIHQCPDIGRSALSHQSVLNYLGLL